MREAAHGRCGKSGRTPLISPVTETEFGEALARLGAPRRFIVAVSGGPDSMALARLAAMRRSLHGVLAVTVDHGLRAAARAEAEQAGEWCRAAGIDHRILVWEGDKPSTGVQAAARAARYRLLAALAEAEGYEAVLTAHNEDDQAETVFMRLARGAGPLGLAGMEPRLSIAAGPGKAVALLRPLLGFSRARIGATLGALGQNAIADPSNDDQGFERVRVRALLAALNEQALLTRQALVRTAARMRAAALRLETDENAAFAAADGRFGELGEISLALRPGGLPEGLAERPGLVARLIRAAGGGEHAPAEEAAAAALEVLRGGGAASLGGVIIRRRHARLVFCREPAALFGRADVAPMQPEPLAPGGRMIWDGRFIIRNGGQTPLLIAPKGPGSDDADGASGPREALQTAPAVIGQDGAPNRLAARLPGVTVTALAEERFFGRVLRFR